MSIMGQLEAMMGPKVMEKPLSETFLVTTDKKKRESGETHTGPCSLCQGGNIISAHISLAKANHRSYLSSGGQETTVFL